MSIEGINTLFVGNVSPQFCPICGQDLRQVTFNGEFYYGIPTRCPYCMAYLAFAESKELLDIISVSLPEKKAMQERLDN